jgi:hypothetical protein
MFLNDPRQGAQRLIGFSRTREGGGDIRFQHYYGASRSIPGCILVARSAAEIILGKNLVDIGPMSGFPSTE